MSGKVMNAKMSFGQSLLHPPFLYPNIKGSGEFAKIPTTQKLGYNHFKIKGMFLRV